MRLTPDQLNLHEKAIHLCQNYQRIEWDIVEVLQKVEKTKFYLKLEVTSLFQYVVQFLKLSESTAYMFISVARKSKDIPTLGEAIRSQRLSVSKASRIVSALNKANAIELIDFAEKNSTRAIDKEVARLNPKANSRERAKPISENFFELNFCISHDTFQKFKRAQSVLAQKQGKHSDMSRTLDVILDEYLKKNDPVEKANRVVKKVKLCATELDKPPGPRKVPTRSPLAALEKHQVFSRDGGRCTYRDHNGNRCENDRWLHIHHVQPVSLGGTNSPENLTTLCSSHHDLVHQLSFPIEGQVKCDWLRL